MSRDDSSTSRNSEKDNVKKVIKSGILPVSQPDRKRKIPSVPYPYERTLFLGLNLKFQYVTLHSFMLYYLQSCLLAK
jgi:hypothetical protein